jgi:hypothetical protein
MFVACNKCVLIWLYSVRVGSLRTRHNERKEDDATRAMLAHKRVSPALHIGIKFCPDSEEAMSRHSSYTTGVLIDVAQCVNSGLD